MKLTCPRMATFDQLAADQRAIIEIVLRQNRSYDEIGEMLDLPPARVRDLARDALAELAPYTADFVDPQWRGQLADYVLGQQTGPEAQATRGHLRRSEPARIWAYSLLDALDDFYDEGDCPEIPVGETGGKARPREREAAANGEGPPGAPRRPRPPRARGRGRSWPRPCCRRSRASRAPAPRSSTRAATSRSPSCAPSCRPAPARTSTCCGCTTATSSWCRWRPTRPTARATSRAPPDCRPVGRTTTSST